jgi:O-antigen/teichoic acid export membrane protein
MYVGIGVFVVMAMFEVFQWLLMAKRQATWYSAFAMWKSIGSFGIALLLIFFLKRGIESLLWGIILSTGIILPLLCKKAVGSASVIRSKINPPFVKKMAKYSFPLIAGNLAAWILSLSDRYILEFFRGSQEVGIYSASYNVSEKSVMLIVTLFMLASGPIAMHIWEKEGNAKSKEFLNEVTRYYLLTCVPVVVGLSVLAKPLIGILTGQEYFVGYKIIPFVASGVLFLGLQQQFQTGFLYHKKTGFITLAIVVSGLLNLVLNFLFIPNHGYMGAAVTTSISYTFLLFFVIVGSRRIFVWEFPFKSLINSICASGIMGVAVYYMSNNLVFSGLINLISSICIGVATYFLALLLLRELSREEIQMLYLLKQKVM